MSISAAKNLTLLNEGKDRIGRVGIGASSDLSGSGRRLNYVSARLLTDIFETLPHGGHCASEKRHFCSLGQIPVTGFDIRR